MDASDAAAFVYDLEKLDITLIVSLTIIKGLLCPAIEKSSPC